MVNKALENYLEEFKQDSLRNPFVEQVVTETLRVVKDIWDKYGRGAKDFFNEIHIELGRDMKNTADERKRLTNIVSDNEATNLRIKLLLSMTLLYSNIQNGFQKHIVFCIKLLRLLLHESRKQF